MLLVSKSPKPKLPLKIESLFRKIFPEMMTKNVRECDKNFERLQSVRYIWLKCRWECGDIKFRKATFL